MDKTVEKKEFNGENILEVKNLKKYFVIKKSLFGKPEAYLKAVDNVSFSVKTGTTIGVVGESGCGKPRSEEPFSNFISRTAGRFSSRAKI